VLLFDEAIVAKNNRSMKKSIKQGKMTTPFLHDESWKISDSFTPPAPRTGVSLPTGDDIPILSFQDWTSRCLALSEQGSDGHLSGNKRFRGKELLSDGYEEI
jgi:hypothetical protein